MISHFRILDLVGKGDVGESRWGQPNQSRSARNRPCVTGLLKPRSVLALFLTLLTLAGATELFAQTFPAFFPARRDFAVGESPNSVRIADFNIDSVQDLVVANGGSDSVSILLGSGGGTFAVAQSFAVGTRPGSVEVDDFNGDSMPDLVVTNRDSDSVSILLGHGDGTFAEARDWRAEGNVVWNYQDSSLPVRVEARAESKTGDSWVQAFPTEMFFWLEPDYQPMRNGQRSLGMIKQTPLSAQEALLNYVVLPLCGSYPDFRVVSSRQIPNLAEAMGDAAVRGQSVAIRVAYQKNGQSIEEEFYGMLSDTQSVPFHGPQGTTVEHHTWLQYVHSMGAAGNKLDSMKSLLGGIASSFTVNPSWLRSVAQVGQYLAQDFNARLAQVVRSLIQR